MKMIAFYNNKGGVGKTSTAINIAYTLSRRENRVLLIDFDGQCNSSRFFTDLTNDEIGCERAIVCTDEKPLIKKTRYDNIDIVTSSVRMNAISNEFVNLSDEEKQSNIIKFRQSTYDYIIVDMPPAMNDFTENVLTICDGTNYQPSRFPKGTRKSLLLTLLCVFFVSPRKTYREHTNYRLSDRTTANTNIIRTKYRCENIRYGDLISAQGNNFAVKIPADQLGKIIVLPIFYSANVNLETNTAVITVKEYNKEIICQALGYDSKKIAQQSDKLINSQKYKRLKDYAASSNTKLSYMIVTKIQLELLKMNEIELAAFPKDDGKYNVAFMPDTKELITKILYPSDDSKQESEYERNSRINNEIKRLAAINGEKPKYRMVAPELLDNIKQSGIQFAYFKKGDKYNIVFLRENEMKIDQLLKQFRKKN